MASQTLQNLTCNTEIYKTYNTEFTSFTFQAASTILNLHQVTQVILLISEFHHISDGPVSVHVPVFHRSLPSRPLFHSLLLDPAGENMD
ncbi:hypothetical protein KOW79_005871 [Hemibagrus wyckioides]|uniref:Uncharacterized protein n=1 Tax=Hemibagrus wyckioides TaxID=337641 RepID=A0A9D3P0A5_9TELE|nr:hypothetical protein KOW79_005871 [Hemibagrus wyckioides]